MRLVDSFIPFMAFVRHFQRQPSGDAAAVGAQLDGLLAEARRSAHQAGASDADTMDGLFAVAAWADEVLMAANWPGAEDWKRQLLQRRYFNVSNAGVAFFSRLDNLGAGQLAVREVYFFCLSMGFSGRYGHDRNPQVLGDIRQACLDQLVQGGGGLYGESGRMFPQAYVADAAAPAAATGPARRWGWQLSTLGVNALVVPLVVLVLLYGIYHVIIWQTVNSIMAQIT